LLNVSLKWLKEIADKVNEKDFSVFQFNLPMERCIIKCRDIKSNSSITEHELKRHQTDNIQPGQKHDYSVAFRKSHPPIEIWVGFLSP
jgi:hypothetical protein